MRSGWETRALGDVADQCLGKMLDKSKNRGTPRPYLRNLNVRWFEFDLCDVSEMRFEDHEFERYTARKGDLIVCEGGYPGRAAIWPHEDPIYLQKALHRVRFREPETAKWFLYFLYFADLNGTLRNHFSGTGIQHFTGEALRRFQLPLPSIREQRSTVAILDEAFAGIDAAIANTEKNLANARELFEGYLRSIFNQANEGWIEKTLGDICENLDSRRVPVTKSERTAGGVPYYGASGIVDHVSGHIFDEDILLISEDGANLLARTYPIAFSVSGKSWVNNHAHVVRFPRYETQRLVEFYLNSISLAPYVSGMAQPKLNQKSLNSIPVPLPPLAEQVRLVALIEKLQDGVERLEANYRERTANLAELKQAILRKAFAGELTANPEKALQEAAD